MHSSKEHGSEELHSRADLDIALARLALRLDRAASYVVDGMTDVGLQERHAALADWFSTISDAIVSNAGPAHRRYAQNRVDAIAAACPALSRPSRRVVSAGMDAVGEESPRGTRAAKTRPSRH